jgi:type IVB pilus formation R64 PilN family outer membrane protein
MTVMTLSGMKPMNLTRFFAVLLAVLTLASCRTEDYRNTISERQAIAEQRVEEARQPAAARRYNPLTVTDAVWTGARALRMRNGLPLPQRVEGTRSVAIISAAPMSLRAIASSVFSQTGIPVRVSKEADEGGDSASAPAASTSSSSSSSAAAPTRSNRSATRAAAPTPTGPSNGMRLSYEGPLSGLLEQASNHFGVTWRYDGGAVSISKYETRVFTLDAMPGTQTAKDGMKEPSSGESGSGSGSAETVTIDQQAAEQSSSMQIDFKFWDEIGKTVESLLAGVGTYALSPSSGTITVMTTPEVMRTVAEYINSENDRLGRQIAINVEVYTVDINEGEDFSNKFTAALQGSQTRAKFSFSNIGSAPSPVTVSDANNLGQIGISIIDPTDGGVINMFNLLSSVGNTARVAQFPMTTLNNRPVARRIGQDRTYLASIQTNTSDSFQNTTLTPGVVRDGFSIQVTPRILGDGRILLQYSLSLIDVLSIDPFTSGANSIQLPRTSTRLFVQQSMLRSGATLVLGGFDQDQVSQESTGMGNAYNFLLGGGVSNSRVRQILFVAMTPQEISLPRTENE